MSKLATDWALTVKLRNPTAKQLLRFYAARHIKNHGIEIKISDLVDHLKVSRTSLFRATQTLVKQKLITKQTQVDERGAQLPNIVYLNIPQTFIDEHQG